MWEYDQVPPPLGPPPEPQKVCKIFEPPVETGWRRQGLTTTTPMSEDDKENRGEVVRGEGGVRLLSRTEQECRLLIRELSFGAAGARDRVFTLDAAFLDFVRCGYIQQYYLVEEPAIHVTGCILLEKPSHGEIGIANVCLLPVRPQQNMGLLLEAVNTVLVSTRPCFAGVEQVFLRLGCSTEFDNGILPSSNSPPHFIVSQLTMLYRNGFLAEVWSKEHEAIDVEKLDSYNGFFKTRLAALWRSRRLLLSK